MSEIWVDTDFGFDDLWALLLLRRFGVAVAGVSLVAGNTPLPRVVANAMGAREAYGLDWPLWQGAARPLVRDQETAERILGAEGMRSRGTKLPLSQPERPRDGAVDALRAWLSRTPESKQILALGPLTNIAELLRTAPETAQTISRLVWMGGSTGRGNHTNQAEFNAFADPEAADLVLSSGLRVDVVDLQFCRGVTFTEADMPVTDHLTGDLLGGYLDIALERSRAGMAIYDPLAALAIAAPEAIRFAPATVTVSTDPGESYGATRVQADPRSRVRFATEAKADLKALCLNALKMEAANGP